MNGVIVRSSSDDSLFWFVIFISERKLFVRAAHMIDGLYMIFLEQTFFTKASNFD